MTYPTWDLAARRVHALTQQGIWPGIRQQGDGTYALTYDPDDAPKDNTDA